MQADSCWRHTCGERDGELSPTGDIEAHTGVGDPTHNLRREIGLAGVVDDGGRTDGGGLGVERMANALGLRTNVSFVKNIQGCSELGREGGRAHACDGQFAAVIARHVVAPQARRELVRIRLAIHRGHAQPVRCEWVRR